MVNHRIYARMWHGSTRRLFTIVHTKYNFSYRVNIINSIHVEKFQSNIVISISTSLFYSAITEDIPLHWPVLHKLSNIPNQWPQNAIVLPGRSLFYIEIISFRYLNLYIDRSL